MASRTHPAFIGRAAELAQLQAALDRARTGQPATILLGGEAGVGKSSLVATFIESAGNAFVAVGGSPPGAEHELPFVVVTELLRSVARQLTSAEASEVLGPARPYLAPLLPTGANDESAGANRTTLFEGILGSIERLAALRGPAVLVFEDLHWADRSTRELLAYLVHSLREGRILLVGTYRLDDVPVGHPLRMLLAELDRSSFVERLELARFTHDEVREQLAGLGRDPGDDDLVTAISARSDGNPYFVEELATSESGHEAMPSTLRELLGSRVAGLPSGVDQLLRLCAAYGPEVDHRLIAAMAPASPHDLALLLRDAIGRNLLVSRRDGERETFAFAHALLHEVVYEDMLAVERQRYHRAIAQVIELHPDYVIGPPALVEGVIAFQWLRAAAPARARLALVRAGIAAEDAFAFPEAASAYETALRLWSAADADEEQVEVGPQQRPIGFRMAPVATEHGSVRPDRPEVVRRAATVLSLTGRADEAIVLMQGLVAEAGPGAAATDWLRLGRYLDADGDTPGALAAFDEAERRGVDEPRVTARVVAARAGTLVGVGRFREARVAAERALELADRAGSVSVARSARETLGIALAMDGDVEAGLSELAQARRTAESSRRQSVVQPRPSQIGEVVRGLAGRAAVYDRAGRPTDFGAAAREGADVARELGVAATLGSTISIMEARNRFLAGDWDLVDRATREMLAMSLGRADSARLHLLRSWLDTGRGAFDAAAVQIEAAAMVLRSRGDPGLLGEFAAREAELAIWRAQLTDARDAVDRGIAGLHEAEDQVAIIGLAWLGIRAEADRAEGDRVRRAQADLADSVRIATALRAEVVALRARSSAQTIAAPRELRVLAAFGEAEWSRLVGPSDPERWATATDHATAIRDPWLMAYGQWRGAEALMAGRGQRSTAEGLVRSAYDTAARLDAEPLLAELKALARRARIDVGRIAAAPELPAKPSARDTLGLTAREVEVLGLVAEGYTNRRIAETLFITEKTAGHHVSNVLGKLGASTRVEAAAMAHRLGLLD